VAGRTSPSDSAPRDRARRTGYLAALLLAGVATSAGCGSFAAGAGLGDSLPTREAAAQAVLDALWTRDPERLLRLALTEGEFRTTVWPRLPASRPEMGMPLEYLWSDTAAKSRAGLAEVLQAHGRQRLRLDRIEFGGPAVDYGVFRIHPKTALLVRDQAGRRSRIRVFGSMIEADGRWKIYSFVVD
jgi:hypothetical protein